MTSVQQDQKGQEDQKDHEGRGQDPRPHQVKGAHIITERIEVGVPIERAYEQWTQYDHWNEMFKKESAKVGGGAGSGQEHDSGGTDRDRGSDEPTGSGKKERGGDRRAEEEEVTVTAKIGPSRRAWTAEITEEDPPHRISWRARGGVDAHGTTTFHRLADRLTKVMVEIEYRPSGVVETVGNFFRMQRRRVRRDLRLFKNHVELRSAGRNGRDG